MSRLVYNCLCSLVLILFFAQSVQALDKLSFDVEQIKMNHWHLDGVSISLFDLDNQLPKLSLSINQILLPKPFSGISWVDIKCRSFSWQDNKISCQQGKATLLSDLVSSTDAVFSFTISEKHSLFSIKNLQFAQGQVSLQAEEKGGSWNIFITTQDLNLHSIYALLENKGEMIEEISSGLINLDINLKGNQQGINSFLIKAEFRQVSLKVKQDRLLLDKLDFDVDGIGVKQNKSWSWKNNIHLKQGELYSEPIYLAIKDKGISMESEGQWSEKSGAMVSLAKLNHFEVATLELKGIIKQKPELIIETAQVFIDILDMGRFSEHYILPFTKQAELDGIKIKGLLKANIKISQSIVQQVSGALTNFSVDDEKQRVMINKARADINWVLDSEYLKPSYLFWDEVKIKSIPIESGQLGFLFRNKEISVLKPSSLTLLGGEFDITKFSWQHNNDDEPKVYFEGGVRNVSLEQLSQALDWTPLTGNISGNIPGVDYQNKILSLKGELKVDVFDGVIKINNLASSGLFTNFSKFNMDMELDNLDLHAITKKFQTGEIEGRVSGSIKGLYLENWEPVSFYAWLGTPAGDESKHRISQKAVENIASIGGGGAADVISKGFLRFFDTFHYDRLGFGCYLHEGVCQLMGVEATDSGYYFIKGGGLPRIDVIGYNTQVDWKVLVERLSRISTTDEVVIE